MRPRWGDLAPTLRLALSLAVLLQVPPTLLGGAPPTETPTGTPTAGRSPPTGSPSTAQPPSSPPPSIPFGPQDPTRGTLGAGSREGPGPPRFYSWRALPPGEALWEDLPAGRPGVRTHRLLSRATRGADRLHLSFPFPYFGHELTDITVTTGGFVSTVVGPGHADLTSAQFIAPLMADFAPGIDPRSSINHLDNGSMMVVEWRDVRLQNDSRKPYFTFQVSLHRSGRIVFAYRQVPVPVASLASPRHPVRVGLSDAFSVTPQGKPVTPLNDPVTPRDNPGPAGGWPHVLYEYERVTLDLSLPRSGAAVEFEPLPTCQQMRSCAECVSARIGFHCFWCHGVGRCSHGLDRYRPQWVEAGCPEKTHGDICDEVSGPNLTSAAPGTRERAMPSPSRASFGAEQRPKVEKVGPSASPGTGPGSGPGGLFTVLGTLAMLVLLLVSGMAAATFWAPRPRGDERPAGCLGRPTPREPPYHEVCEML